MRGCILGAGIAMNMDTSSRISLSPTVVVQKILPLLSSKSILVRQLVMAPALSPPQRIILSPRAILPSINGWNPSIESLPKAMEILPWSIPRQVLCLWLSLLLGHTFFIIMAPFWGMKPASKFSIKSMDSTSFWGMAHY